MNKVINYIKRCGGILISENENSKYFLLDNKLIRVSNHIGVNSSGNIQFICTKHDYLVYNKTTGAIGVLNYESVKCFIRNAHLLSSMDVNCDKSQVFVDNCIGEGFKRQDFTPNQIKQIESFININKKHK